MRVIYTTLACSLLFSIYLAAGMLCLPYLQSVMVAKEALFHVIAAPVFAVLLVQAAAATPAMIAQLQRLFSRPVPRFAPARLTWPANQRPARLSDPGPATPTSGAASRS